LLSVWLDSETFPSCSQLISCDCSWFVSDTPHKAMRCKQS